jgi:hypothetical protein
MFMRRLLSKALGDVMKFGCRTQKVVLCSAAVFAVLATLYALSMAVFCVASRNNWIVLVIWAAIVLAYGPVLMKLFINAWRLVDRVHKS